METRLSSVCDHFRLHRGEFIFLSVANNKLRYGSVDGSFCLWSAETFLLVCQLCDYNLISGGISHGHNSQNTAIMNNAIPVCDIILTMCFKVT